MKFTFIVLLTILSISCQNKTDYNNKKSPPTHPQRIIQPSFQSIIDSSNVKGAILIYDLAKDIYYSNDFNWSVKGHLPASTFKIPNTIIGLETGIIESDATMFKWDGEEKWLSVWEQDLILKDAFQYSCVPCYQELARKIGPKKMLDYAERLQYGNLNIDSTNIDQFWLRGKSRINQMEQIDFLKRFYKQELPVSERTIKIVKNIMLFEETDHYKISGKSGLSNENDHYNGWFVGFVELKNNTFFFATNLEPNKSSNLNTFAKKRLEISKMALTEMKILN